MRRHYYLVRVNRNMLGLSCAKNFFAFEHCENRDAICAIRDDADYVYYAIKRDDLIEELASYLLEESAVYVAKSDIRADMIGAMAEYNAKHGLL